MPGQSTLIPDEGSGGPDTTTRTTETNSTVINNNTDKNNNNNNNNNNNSTVINRTGNYINALYLYLKGKLAISGHLSML